MNIFNTQKPVDGSSTQGRTICTTMLKTAFDVLTALILQAIMLMAALLAIVLLALGHMAFAFGQMIGVAVKALDVDNDDLFW